MRPRKIFTGLGCSIYAAPFQLRIRQYSIQQSHPSSRNPSARQPPPKTKPSKLLAAAHKLPQPLILHPSTAYNYTPQKGDKDKAKSEKMGPQSIQIPGLTLLNSLTPHAIAPTSEGGFISAGAAPKSQVAVTAKRPTSTTTATTTILPLKKKENKKAKARRLLAEEQAQAQAQAQAAANHNGYPHAPNQYETIFFSRTPAFFLILPHCRIHRELTSVSTIIQALQSQWLQPQHQQPPHANPSNRPSQPHQRLPSRPARRAK